MTSHVLSRPESHYRHKQALVKVALQQFKRWSAWARQPLKVRSQSARRPTTSSR